MRRFKSLKLWVGVAIAVAFIALVGVPVGEQSIDAHRARVAAWTDRPAIVLQWPDDVTFPDAAHVSLPDGRTFRLAHVVPPPTTGPTLDSRTEQALSIACHGGGRDGFGVKPVGRSADGETLVELWSLRPSLGGCGNATWSERRAQRIPHWEPQTDALVRSGMYRLQADVADPDLRFWEADARKNGEGLWADPSTIRSAFDRAILFDRVTRFVDGRQTTTLNQRGEAADLLLRGWPEAAASMVRFVQDDGPADTNTRVCVAIILDQHGDFTCTDALMRLLHNGWSDQTEYGRLVQAIADHYGTYWNIASSPDWVFRHYQTSVLPTRTATTRAAAR